MCEKCDSILEQLEQQGIDPEAGLFNLAKDMLKKMASVQVEVLVCKTLNPKTGQAETMRLVKEENVKDITERLHLAVEKSLEMLDQISILHKVSGLMHENLEKMSAIIDATGNPSAIAALAAVHNDYEERMEALSQEDDAFEEVDPISSKIARTSAMAEEILANPEIPQEIKDLVTKMEAKIGKFAATLKGNGTVH